MQKLWLAAFFCAQTTALSAPEPTPLPKEIFLDTTVDFVDQVKALEIHAKAQLVKFYTTDVDNWNFLIGLENAFFRKNAEGVLRAREDILQWLEQPYSSAKEANLEHLKYLGLEGLPLETKIKLEKTSCAKFVAASSTLSTRPAWFCRVQKFSPALFYGTLLPWAWAAFKGKDFCEKQTMLLKRDHESSPRDVGHCGENFLVEIVVDFPEPDGFQEAFVSQLSPAAFGGILKDAKLWQAYQAKLWGTYEAMLLRSSKKNLVTPMPKFLREALAHNGPSNFLKRQKLSVFLMKEGSSGAKGTCELLQQFHKEFPNTLQPIDLKPCGM